MASWNYEATIVKIGTFDVSKTPAVHTRFPGKKIQMNYHQQIAI
jgi:hypothetical protein